MKIFVCEDDQRQREHMVSIIKNYIMIEEKPMELALATNDPYEVLEESKELNDIGCYFLDIQLEADMNGIKLASEIRELKMRIIDCLETAHTRLKLLSKESNVDTIELKRGSNSVYVQYDDIMFFESSTKSHRLIAHLDNRQIEFYGNLKELAQLDERFFRCHNSFVINRHNIESIDSKERIVYFKNGENCFASVRNVKKI